MSQNIRDFWIAAYLEQKKASAPAFSQLIADQEVLEHFGEKGKVWIKHYREQARLDLDRIDASQIGGQP